VALLNVAAAAISLASDGAAKGDQIAAVTFSEGWRVNRV
jgi:hypothetical protein